MGLVTAKGRLRLRSFRAAYAYTKQASIDVADLMVNVAPGQTHTATDLAISIAAGCAHAQPVTVPHNNQIAVIEESGVVTDPDRYLEAGLPPVAWTVLARGATKKYACLKDGAKKHQRLACRWTGLGVANDAPTELTLDARARVACQAFQLKVARQFWGGAPISSLSNYELRFTAGFRQYRVRVQNNEWATVWKNESGPDSHGARDESGWTLVSSRFRIGAADADGNTGPEAGLTLDVSLLSRTLQLSVGGDLAPYRIPGDVLGPTRKAGIATRVPGGNLTGTFSVAYTWIDGAGNESDLSPAYVIADLNHESVSVLIPEGPFEAKTVRIYAAGPNSDGWRLIGSAANQHGGFVQSVTLPLDSEDAPTGFNRPVIQEVQVKARGFTRFDWELHPGKWKPLPTLDSNPVALGAPPDPSTEPFYAICGSNTNLLRDSGEPWDDSDASDPPLRFPPGSSITVTTTSDEGAQDVTYQLVLSTPVAGQYAGEDYADYTPVVTRVHVLLAPLFEACGPTLTYPCTPSRAVIPKELTERIVFQPAAKTIVHDLQFVLDNWYGQWAGQGGNIAVKLWLGLLNPASYPGVHRSNGDPTTDTDGGKLWRRFEGICGDFDFQIPAANRSVVGCSATDRMVQFEVPIENPPLMDGWNDYAALAYLAMRGHFSPDKLAFRGLVPTISGGTLESDPTGIIDPYTTAPGDTRTTPFLPVGTGNHSWTPRNRAMDVIELMQFVQKPSGKLLYIDQDGRLQFHKFVPLAAPGPTKVFSNDPSTWGADGEPLREFWNFRVMKSTRDIRNQVILIGVDPFREYYNLVISRRTDRESISAKPGSEPWNYIGYPKPFLWTDPRFADAAFTAEAADAILEMISIPGIEASFECWLQPDLFPMDVIFVTDEKTGIRNIPLLIMSISNRWAVSGSGLIQPRSSITAKFLI